MDETTDPEANRIHRVLLDDYEETIRLIMCTWTFVPDHLIHTLPRVIWRLIYQYLCKKPIQLSEIAHRQPAEIIYMCSKYHRYFSVFLEQQNRAFRFLRKSPRAQDTLSTVKLLAADDKNGVHVTKVVSLLSSRYHHQDIFIALDYLQTEGLIYTTFSDEYFQVAGIDINRLFS